MSNDVCEFRSNAVKACWMVWALCTAALPGIAQPVPTAAARAFDRVLLLEEKAETSAGVSVGDLNGDGRPDIVLGKGRHWPLFNRVLLNDGHGGFTEANLGAAPDRTYSAALADVDGDGALDIVVSNDAPDRKRVYRNDGKGHFAEFGTFGDSNWSTRYVTLADLNGDGAPDIVAANRGDYPDLVDGKPGPGRPVPAPSYVCFNGDSITGTLKKEGSLHGLTVHFRKGMRRSVLKQARDSLKEGQTDLAEPNTRNKVFRRR